MKIKARPKIRHKTPLYTTICIIYFYNYTKIIYPYSNLLWSFSALYYSIKLVLNHFIIIKT